MKLNQWGRMEEGVKKSAPQVKSIDTNQKTLKFFDEATPAEIHKAAGFLPKSKPLLSSC